MSISSFNGLNVALRGLLTQQAALDVTSHNIANANTAGYSRQEAVLTEEAPLSNVSVWGMQFPGQMGQGVTVDSYRRIRDVFNDAQLRQASGEQSGEQIRYRELSGIETAMPEPSTNGLGALMQGFFDAWHAVSNSPESTAARQALAQQAISLTTAFNSASTSLANMRTSDDSEINSDVTDINTTTTQIASLNKRIGDLVLAGAQIDPATGAIVKPGQIPNDLLDQRDQLLDHLSQVADVSSVTYDDQNRATVIVAGQTLVGGTTGAATLTRAQVDAAFSGGQLTRGKLFGLEDAHNNMLDESNTTSYASQLNTLAQSLHDAVNAQHALGADLSGAAGGTFLDFTTPAGPPGAAGRLIVSAAIVGDPTKIAAGTVGEGAGSAGNANAMVALQQQVNTAGATLQDYYNGLQSRLGTAAQSSSRTSDANDVVVNGLSDRRAASSGVSLDEEMANMIKFQHAYAASARVLTAMDQNLQTILAMVR